MANLGDFADVASIVSVGITAVPVIERLLEKYWSKDPGAQYHKWVSKVDEILEKVIPLIEMAPAAHTLAFLRAFRQFVQSKRRLEQHLKTSRGVWQRYFKGYKVSKTYAKLGREARQQGIRLSHHCLLLDTVKAIEGRHVGVIPRRHGLETLEDVCKRSPRSRKELEEFCKIVSLELGTTVKISFLSEVEETHRRAPEETTIETLNTGPPTNPFQNEIEMEDRESGFYSSEEINTDKTLVCGEPSTNVTSQASTTSPPHDMHHGCHEDQEMDTLSHLPSESYQDVALEVTAMDASMNEMSQHLEALTQYLRLGQPDQTNVGKD